METSESEEKCEVCSQPGHGVHFGVFACRACAAFFRRSHFSREHKPCRNLQNKCSPNQYGKWLCKKCRLGKCLEIGMSTENIQYDRDSFNSSETFAMKKALEKGISYSVEVPTTVERLFGVSHLIIFLNSSGNNKSLPYIDTSQLVAKAIDIVLTPNLVRKTKALSNLEQLTQGIEDSRFSQRGRLSLKEFISQDDHKNEFERSMCQTAKWLSCSDQIRQFDDKTKISILQSIWFIWGRLERMATTARLRMKNLCGKTQFVISPGAVIDYDEMKSDISHVSIHNFEEMKL
ncbi:hypothetical protein GCK72_018981 [Caenorhabditis remanei]|uniref:Nuclear receptor domain-containing protein n=1 Tax=Caenorhabditis remanei TaxID=31234 RepID=A0A6A5GC43_CAERE|nr:hypothetical protein GCK72_018981 [Caenorhabditis remanei]KAF1752426.1 hypothetical protein GCK72_018981 [Caenorhabditis remanei]